MKGKSKHASRLSEVVSGLVKALCLITGLFLIDRLPLLWNDIEPPKELETIEEFNEWKANLVMREGVFEHEGNRYIVFMGGRSAFLSSGPAAYIFDQDGKFIDWTPDMGDVYTKRNDFNLTSGNVK